MDINRTREYYASLTDEDLCQCELCTNYMKKVRAAYPKVAAYLETLGIDIEKPHETMPLEPGESDTVIYDGPQYVVLGSKEDFIPKEIDGVTIGLAESYPPSDLDEQNFVIELSAIYLSWEAGK